MHHLILVREFDSPLLDAGGGAAGGRERGGSAEQRALLDRMGLVYRAVRAAFGEAVQITVVDPRNQLAFLPLVLRDSLRYRVPLLTALQAAASAGVATAIFDGQLLFRGEVPPAAQVVEQIRGRLHVYRVGEPPDAGGEAGGGER